MTNSVGRMISITLVAGTKLKEDIEIPEGIEVLEDNQAVPDGHFMFRILSQEKGDERLIWNSRSLPDIQAAKRMFVDLIKKGLKPFKVGVNGAATSEVMDEFDPTAEEVIFLPCSLVVGG